MWIEFRPLLKDQSDLGFQCLIKRLLKHLSRRQNQMKMVVIVALGFNTITMPANIFNIALLLNYCMQM